MGNATQMLRSYPLLGRIVPEYQDEAVRELIVHRSRFSAHDALSGIEDTFLNNGVVVAMRHGRYVQLLYRSVEEGTLGGQVHDAAIVACARQAGVAEILTFNDRHVRRFVGDGLTIAVP
ncbi:MAG: hypothetical protein IT306_26775 [Chloroflexi bacterium]|nr:hypothetical protein [Chloroflexota bacterium]